MTEIDQLKQQVLEQQLQLLQSAHTMAQLQLQLVPFQAQKVQAELAALKQAQFDAAADLKDTPSGAVKPADPDAGSNNA
jgi:hypothetical protein